MEDDFGFSFEDAIPQDFVDKHERRVDAIKTLIMPLLNGLLRDPAKEVIKWPNRIDQVKAIIKKIDEV